MRLICRNVMILVGGMTALGAATTWGQNYPTKPIRIVTVEPGGGNDIAARLIAQGLTANLGVQVVVENRGGGNGAIAAQTVAKSPPDGYTMLLYSNTIWTLPLIQPSVPYDPVRDFAPITLALTSPNVLVVHSSLPVKNVKELIALAKARPGELNYATGAIGATAHLAAELLKSMAHVNIVHIPYKSNGIALNNLIAGEVQLSFSSAGSVAAHVKSGRLRALAVTTAQPSALLPGLPTVAASGGLPGYEAASVNGILAPAGTPPAIVNRLYQEIARVLNTADIRQRFLANGVEPVGSTPEEFAATIKSEIVRLSKVVKDANIRAD